jgi:LysM repeat protein
MLRRHVSRQHAMWTRWPRERGDRATPAATVWPHTVYDHARAKTARLQQFASREEGAVAWLGRIWDEVVESLRHARSDGTFSSSATNVPSETSPLPASLDPAPWEEDGAATWPARSSVYEAPATDSAKARLGFALTVVLAVCSGALLFRVLADRGVGESVRTYPDRRPLAAAPSPASQVQATAPLAATSIPTAAPLVDAGARAPAQAAVIVVPVPTAIPAVAVPTAIPAPTATAVTVVAPQAAAPIRPPQVAESLPRTHVVEAGDTLFNIARRSGTTVDALVSVNDLGSRDAIIRIGQRLAVP